MKSEWSRKNYFEIPSYEKLFSLTSENSKNHKSNKNNHLHAWREFKINLSRPLFTMIFRPKIVFLDTDFHFQGKNDA